MSPTLTPAEVDRITAPLRAGNAAFVARYPGERPDRQPVHTVYGGAHLFRSDTARKLGELALKALEEHAPDAPTFATAFGMPPGARGKGATRACVHKLEREAVEDFRIDFEDGYGTRPDDEEDGHAVAGAREVAQRTQGRRRCRRSSASASSR